MPTIRSRTTKNGSRRFHVAIRKAGFAPLSRTFRSERDALRWAAVKETEIDSGRYVDRAESTRHTLAETIDRYKSEVMPRRLRRAKDEEAHLDYWRCELGARKLSEIRPSDIVRCRDKLATELNVRGKQRKPATVNRYL